MVTTRNNTFWEIHTYVTRPFYQVGSYVWHVTIFPPHHSFTPNLLEGRFADGTPVAWPFAVDREIPVCITVLLVVMLPQKEIRVILSLSSLPSSPWRVSGDVFPASSVAATFGHVIFLPVMYNAVHYCTRMCTVLYNTLAFLFYTFTVQAVFSVRKY